MIQCEIPCESGSEQVGRVLAAAIGESSAINKTFEVRRGDEENAELKHNMHSMFTTLAVDTDRSLIGIRPFPGERNFQAPQTNELHYVLHFAGCIIEV